MPVTTADGVYVADAWLRAAESGFGLFIVVNNTSDTVFDGICIDVSGITDTIISLDGSRESISISFLAELHMTEKGLQVAVVCRQDIWRDWRRDLAEEGPRLLVDVKRRLCCAASADVRWSAV